MHSVPAAHTEKSNSNRDRDRWSLDVAASVLAHATDHELRAAVCSYLDALSTWLSAAALWGAATAGASEASNDTWRAAWCGVWGTYHDTALDRGTDPCSQAHELVGGALFVACGFTARELVEAVACMSHPEDHARYLTIVRHLRAALQR